MGEAWVVIDTSGRGGRVGLAVGDEVRHAADLDPARRHARDLAPTIAAHLAAERLTAKQVAGVMVSVGPGSFTGLRVGVVSAKVFAFATGCRLVAVPTFQPVADQVPADVSEVDVVADGLQGMVYAQRFTRSAVGMIGGELRLLLAAEWLAACAPAATGPGLALHEAKLPAGVRAVAAELRTPTLAATFRAGRRLAPLTEEEVWRLEPLYLRPSSAEEQAARKAAAL